MIVEMNVKIDSKRKIWAEKAAEHFGVPVDVIVDKALHEQMVKYPLGTETCDYDRKKIAENIVAFFKSAYEQRFAIPCDVPLDVAQPLVNSLKTPDNLENILKKAIYWYLNFHESTGKNGQHYQHSAKMFFGQNWLWQLCVEKTSNMTLETLEKMREGNFDEKKFEKATQRGDVASAFTYNDKTQLLQDAITLAAELVAKYNLPKKIFRERPETSMLFLSNKPNEKEIEQAYAFLRECEASLQ